jgi:ribose 5-phosphate isomerase B
MKIALGADHAGFELKEGLRQFLTQEGHEVCDLGCYSSDSTDYPDFGYAVAHAVSTGACEKGILVCATGIGMSITANKVAGIRAALCHDLFTAEMSRRHNDANVLAMGARIVSRELGQEIIQKWLETPFEGGRHQRRVDKMMDLEKDPSGPTNHDSTDVSSNQNC